MDLSKKVQIQNSQVTNRQSLLTRGLVTGSLAGQHRRRELHTTHYMMDLSESSLDWGMNSFPLFPLYADASQLPHCNSFVQFPLIQEHRSWPVLSSAKEVMVSLLSLGLFVCRILIKTMKMISTKLGGRRRHGPRRKPIHFGTDLDKGALSQCHFKVVYVFICIIKKMEVRWCHFCYY